MPVESDYRFPDQDTSEWDSFESLHDRQLFSASSIVTGHVWQPETSPCQQLPRPNRSENNDVQNSIGDSPLREDEFASRFRSLDTVISSCEI